MRSHQRRLALVVTLSASAAWGPSGTRARHVAAPSPFDGDWAGVIEIRGHTSAVQAHFTSGDSGTKGSIDLFGDATGTDFRDLRTSGDSLRAIIPLRLTGPTEIHAALHGDTLIGRATRRDGSGSLRLLHLARLDTTAAHASEGLYVGGSDTLIVNRVTPTLLALTDATTHELRILYAVGPNEYIAGATLFGALPERWRVRVHDPSSPSATLTLTRDGRTITADRLPLHIEEVRFRHDTVTLGGAFIRPERAGRFPVVIHMHGSGPSIRTSHLGIAYYLAAHGIASLIYDKRGSGASSGNVAWSTYDALGGDAIAGAELMMARPDVDTMHVGFMGISEGATTSIIAAAHFRKSAFVIPVSGGALAPNVWELYEAEDQLATDGRFSPTDTAEAMHFLRARDHYAITRRDWAAYEAALKTAIAPHALWYGYATTDLFGWATPDSRGWDQKVMTYFYDPIPAVRMLDCPVLNVDGAYDVPAALGIAVPLMKRATAEAGNRDVTVRVLPHANHNLFVTKSGNEHEMDNVSHFAPELFPTILEWLHARTKAEASAPRAGPPVEFAPGIVSTGHEFTVTFGPDAREVYFTRSTTNSRETHIMRSELGSNGWMAPERVAFSGDTWADLDPAMSPDGKRLYFVSTRPRPGASASLKPDMDIWYVERAGGSWSPPHWIDAVSSDGKEGSPTVDRAGTLCFFSDRGATANHNAIYCAAPSGASWSPPVRLESNVNAGPSDTSPFLSPDGNTLLFYSERGGGFGQADLYVSTKKTGVWQSAVNVGPVLNTTASEYNPSISPDGRTLYFGRSGRVWSTPVADIDRHILRAEMFK